MATSALDPTFGQGGVVRGTLDTGAGPDLSTVTATTVQSDGKILIAGTYMRPASSAQSSVQVAVRRYNTDGSVDTSFGTNGQVTIPAPAGSNGLAAGPRNLVVQRDSGVIDLAATTVTFGTAGNTSGGLVVQLTANGQLDSSFGTNGEFILPTADVALTSVAVDDAGRVVASGTSQKRDDSGVVQMVVTRLTTAGALDTSFAGTGTTTINVPLGRGGLIGFSGFVGAGVAITSSKQIIVAANQNYLIVPAPQSFANLARLNSDGSLDTSYGSQGILTLPGSGNTSIAGIALQSDDRLVIAGMDTPFDSRTTAPFLVRLQANGAVDPSFPGLPLNNPSPRTRDTFRSVALSTTDVVTVGGTTAAGQLFVERFTSGGRLDTSFGLYGQVTIPVTSGQLYSPLLGGSVALTPSNKVVIGGTVSRSTTTSPFFESQSVLAQVLPIQVVNNATNDFDGDGKSDLAAELTDRAIYAYRKSDGTGDVLQGFGQAGIGASIPVPFNVKGSIAIYLPALGAFAVRYSGSSSYDDLIPFGSAGTGASIPATGDYFGTGTTALAVYLPAQGAFAIKGQAGFSNVLVPFGVQGTGATIPAPGDYDGDGITDLAVYIPGQGILAYRPSSGGNDVTVPFGPAGPGASIPAPGDYDGDGKTDVAVYLPNSGAFAIHPSSGVANRLIPFGQRGAGASIPAPGDYDGDGVTDASVYLPNLGLYAYRPSAGGNDVVQGFGTPGTGITVPVASIPYAQAQSSGTTSAFRIGAVTPSAAVFIPLTNDLTSPTPKKKTTGTA